MTVVVDAAAIVAWLTDPGAVGSWVVEKVGDDRPAAPHLVVFEVANVLRRLELAGKISRDHAVLAHDDLADVPIDLWPYEAVADRAWELRHHVTIYDASYVTLAEQLDAELVTLDAKLAATHGLRCTVLTPPR